MTLLDLFKSKAINNYADIGVGLGASKLHNIKIVNACLQFLNEYKAKIHLFGFKKEIESLKKDVNNLNNSNYFILMDSEEPERKSINLLKEGKLNALIRGSFSSSKFLSQIKNLLRIGEISRLALLETSTGTQFFYGPVGIDECNSFEQKRIFLNKALNLYKTVNIEPKISILSGGREGDLGRDEYVDETIKIAQQIVRYYKNENPNLEIAHDQILIERAIEKQSNLVIAPDGISGNLIYRTLVHLGGGKAYGAIYLDIDKIMIDTSRVGNPSEIYGALILALALIK